MRPFLEKLGLSIGMPKRAIDQAFSDPHAVVRRAASHLKPPSGEPPDGFVHRFAEIVVSGACLRMEF